MSSGAVNLGVNEHQISAPDVRITDGFLPEHPALFEQLRKSICWEESMAVRKTASFGVPYNYAQLSYPAVPMHAALLPVVAKLSAVPLLSAILSPQEFVAVGLNKPAEPCP